MMDGLTWVYHPEKNEFAIMETDGDDVIATVNGTNDHDADCVRVGRLMARMAGTEKKGEK